MKVLAIYLIKAVLSAASLVLLVLLALAGFIEFIQQLDNVGQGNFEVPQAIIFTLLRLPLLSVQMLPVAALLGALLGLGALAGHSELTVMRAAGISKWRLAQAVAVSGVFLLVFGAVVGEFLAPPMDQFARKYRDSLKREQAGLVSERGVWVRDGLTFFHIERISNELDLGRVYLFEFDAERRLATVGHALNAGVDANDSWVLDNFVVTRFDETGASVDRAQQSVQRYNISAELLGVSIIRPGSMSLAGLNTYIGYLTRNELVADVYLSEFWSRIASTVAIVMMPILAIGFVFGSLRSAGAGGRLLVGVVIGLIWFFATRLLANGGQVFDLNPVITAWIPTMALAAVTAFAVSRVR